LTQYDVKVFFNKDYEPYASKRDAACELLEANHVVSYLFKDQVIFEEKKLLKQMDCRTPCTLLLK
jgi:deoxyribodipyrimidine photo-lyase